MIGAAMPLYPAQQKEQFSIAFVRAIAAVSGYNITRCEVDDDSIDLGLKGSRRDGGVRNAPYLDIQVKCTDADDGTGPDLPFDLKLKNYDDLRATPVHVPAILVVVCVPADVGTWLDETPEHTAMRRCAYWRSLRGLPATGNTTTCRVRIPRTQAFTVAVVRSMMTRIGEGGLP